MFQFIPSPFRTTASHTCSTPFPLQELPCRGPDLHRVFLRLPKADPGMPSTLFHRTLHPSFKLLILSYIVVFTCLSPYLIARSLGAGPFLVICVIPAHSPVHGTVHTVGFVQALERSSRTQEGDESQSHRTTGENAGVRRLGMRELWLELGRLSFGGF